MADIEDGDLCSEADSDLGGIGTDHTPPEDDDVSCLDPGHASEENPAATEKLLEVVSAHLGRHAAGNFAHGCQQREAAVDTLDRFIGDASCACSE